MLVIKSANMMRAAEYERQMPIGLLKIEVPDCRPHNLGLAH